LCFVQLRIAKVNLVTGTCKTPAPISVITRGSNGPSNPAALITGTEPLVYRTERRDDRDGIVSFATVTTRVGGQLKVFRAEVTVMGSNGKVATTLDRTFEGRGCQYSARKWSEIMLFYPPARVITHVEL
ncbi:MAG: hypothetical protein MZV70_36305, partial [Desulfobacterales bacterium]|nr:hypothetical protein [Desulfobacterales bacterium]